MSKLALPAGKPYPVRVLHVPVTAGSQVAKGAPVCTVEWADGEIAMIVAEEDARVRAVRVERGQTLYEATTIIEWTRPSETARPSLPLLLGLAVAAVLGAVVVEPSWFDPPLPSPEAIRAAPPEELEGMIERAGGPDPATPEARAVCLEAQAARARKLLEQGKPDRAVIAFGHAARHASDADDLDALEHLIEQQLQAAGKGR